VSPSWRDRVEAYIGVQTVDVVRVRRGVRPRPDAALTLEVTGAPGWTASIETLGRTLPGYASARAEVRAVLSNHFVRYVLVPGIDALSSDEERAALVRHQFLTVHGERAAGWRVALAEHGARTAGLAAALDEDLLEALTATVTAAGFTLRSVEPLLVAAFNACRREIGTAAAWLVVAEPDRLCVAHLAGGAWVELRNARAPRGAGVELPGALEQMRLTLGAHPGPVFVVSRDPVEVEMGADWPMRFVPLGGVSPRAGERAA
jgi:hypothetical protein